MVDTSDLRRRALAGFVKFQIALALMIFLPAWTIRFWEAWLYWVLFALFPVAMLFYFLERDPALLERRLAVGPAAETEASQKRIQAFASVMLVALFVVAGFDRRFHWSPPVGAVLVAAADVAVAGGFVIMFLAFRANSHASAVVEVSAGQTVVSSGPYAWVRHPMYTGALVLFLATPFALTSIWAVLPAVGLAAGVVLRLLDEERYLAAQLPGYTAYRQRVRARLLPGIW
jgi:protein-S-isoprenylcysteine O-methyltransferase Ste14